MTLNNAKRLEKKECTELDSLITTANEENKEKRRFRKKDPNLEKEKNRQRRWESSWTNLPAEKKRKLDMDRFKRRKQIKAETGEKREREEEENELIPEKEDNK